MILGVELLHGVTYAAMWSAAVARAGKKNAAETTNIPNLCQQQKNKQQKKTPKNNQQNEQQKNTHTQKKKNNNNYRINNKRK